MRGDVIRVQGLYGTGTWEQLGVDRYPGREPQGIQYSFNAWGPDSLTFTIQRDPSVIQPDLDEFTPIEVMRGERIVWDGFIIETPAGADRTMTVTARGWQYHLDDQVFTDYYVHSDLGEWKDMRTYPTALLGSANLGSSPQVATGGGISMGFAEGTPATFGLTAGVTLDLGAGNVARRVVIDGYGSAPGQEYDYRFYVRGVNTPNNRTTSGGGWQSGTFSDAIQKLGGADTGIGGFGQASSTYAGSFSTPKRYVQMFLTIAGAGFGSSGVLVNDMMLNITRCLIFEQTSYESGNTSNLHATTVISDALTRAPKLSQSTAKIATTTFDIPSYSFIHEERTPREVMENMNAYHGYILRVNPGRVLEFRAPTNSTRVAVDTNSPGVVFQDASVSSGTNMYNRVIGRGTGGDGERLKYTSSTANNSITKRGYFRDKFLDVQFPVDIVALTQLCTTYLALNSRSVLKGSLEVRTDDAAMGQDGSGKTWGTPIHMSELGQYVGENITISNLVDPDTGALGRVGTIAAVQMNEDSVTLTLDNQRAHFEALLARMGVVTDRS